MPAWLAPVIQAGGAALSGLLSSGGADDATEAQLQATLEQIGFAEESRDLVRGDTAPYRAAGYTALDALMSLSGLPSNDLIRNAANNVKGGIPDSFAESYDWKKKGKVSEYEVVRAFQEFRGRKPSKKERNYYSGRTRGDQLYHDVVEPGLREMQQTRQAEAPPPGPAMTPGEMVKADPSYQFRLEEGMDQLQKSAGAAGGLLSGGFAKKATRYAQDYASTEYGKIWDRIATIAGYGTTGAALSAPATTNAGNVSATAAGNAGYARASGYVAEGNAWANAINEASQADWGAINWGALNPFRGRGTSANGIPAGYGGKG